MNFFTNSFFRFSTDLLRSLNFPEIENFYDLNSFLKMRKIKINVGRNECIYGPLDNVFHFFTDFNLP